MRDLIESCCICDEERTFVAMRRSGSHLGGDCGSHQQVTRVHLKGWETTGCPRPAQVGGHARRMIRRIFLDLDDVCNTLAPFVLHSVGCDIGPTDYAAIRASIGTISQTWPTICWASSLHAGHALGLHPACHLGQGARVTILPWLLEACAEASAVRTSALPPARRKTRESGGKLEWIHDHFPSGCTGSMPSRLASTFCPSDAFLIDDYARTSTFRPTAATADPGAEAAWNDNWARTLIDLEEKLRPVEVRFAATSRVRTARICAGAIATMAQSRVKCFDPTFGTGVTDGKTRIPATGRPLRSAQA